MNKPVFNADFVLHDELGANPDGVLTFVGGLDSPSPTTPTEYINQVRALQHQTPSPVTPAMVAGNVAALAYEADTTGGDFSNSPEFGFPAGWRFHLVVLAVGGHTMAIVYAAPAAKFAAFNATVQPVLQALHFP